MDVSFLNPYFALVPKDNYTHDVARAYLKLATPLLDSEPLRYNNLDSQKIVLVYTYSEDLEFFFENKFPLVRFLHAGYRFIQKIPEKKNGSYLHVGVYTSTIEIAVFQEDSLVYYNNFLYQTEEDIAYYIKLVIKKLDLNEEFTKFRYFGNEKSLQFINQFIPNFKPYQSDNMEQKYFSLID